MTIPGISVGSLRRTYSMATVPPADAPITMRDAGGIAACLGTVECPRPLEGGRATSRRAVAAVLITEARDSRPTGRVICDHRWDTISTESHLRTSRANSPITCYRSLPWFT